MFGSVTKILRFMFGFVQKVVTWRIVLSVNRLNVSVLVLIVTFDSIPMYSQFNFFGVFQKFIFSGIDVKSLFPPTTAIAEAFA